MAAAFTARAMPLSLVGPPDAACPDWAPALTATFGTTMAGHDGALPSGCRWSGEGVVVEVAFVPGMTPDELGDGATAEATDDDCYIRAMPNVAYLAPLLLCEEDGATGWRFQTVDDSGAGVWRLIVTLADDSSADGAVVLADLTDLADRTW